MKYYVLGILLVFVLSVKGQSEASLYITVNQSLITTSTATAGYEPFVEQTGMNGKDAAFKLTWSENHGCFFTTVYECYVTNQIGKIMLDGSFTNLGNVSIPGETVYHLENISYDENTDMLYCSASLDGTVSGNDYYSETLIKVNPETLIGEIVGTYSHDVEINEPEADNIVLDQIGNLYYNDTHPGTNPFGRIYVQDMAMNNSPELIFEEFTGVGILGLEVLNGKLYFTADRHLHAIDLVDYSHSIVGEIFSTSDFEGMNVRGLCKISSDVSGIFSLRNANEANIYPNPSSGIFTLELSEKLNNAELNLWTASGKLVYTSKINELITKIDLSSLSDATYSYQLINEGSVLQAGSLVKQ